MQQNELLNMRQGDWSVERLDAQPSASPSRPAVSQSYFPDRRTAIEAIALAMGGVALHVLFPSTALAKSRKAAKVKRYSIIYRLNGGKNPKKQVKTVKRGAYVSVSKLKRPTRKGYKFAGWYTDRKLKKKARKVAGRAAKSKRTLYAKWKTVTYNISYVLNGGHFAQKAAYKFNVKSKKITLRTPVRKGYKFIGWYSDKKLTKRVYSIKTGSTGNKKFYAKWELQTYSINYDLMGGTAVLAMPANYTVKSPKIVPPAPFRPGYRFVEWCADPALTLEQPFVKSGSAGNTTFYAKWVPTTYWDAHIDDKCVRVNELMAASLADEASDAGGSAGGVPSSGDSGAGIDTGSDVGIGEGGVDGATSGADLNASSADGDAGTDSGSTGVADDKDTYPGAASLVFITDMHVPSNALVSPDLVQKLVQKTDVSMVVFGGDAINKNTNKADAIAMLRFVHDAFADTELHFVRGNHDANNEGSGASKLTEISDLEFVALTAEPHEVREPGSLDYYRDDQERKIRYIFMDTGAPDTSVVDILQLAWLKARILELDEGWTVLLFVHQFFTAYVRYDANGTRIKSVLDSLYDEAKAQIAGVISGHVHHDRVRFSEKGYPMIAVTCDSYLKPMSIDRFPRKLGTTTEQSFDVITLDTRKKMLYLTRVGAGEDREYQYAEPEPAVVPEPAVTPEPEAGAPLQAGSVK